MTVVVRRKLPHRRPTVSVATYHAHDLKLVPSVTVYMRWGKGPKRPLRFTKSGDPKLEEAYARHFVWPGKRRPDNSAQLPRN